MANYIFDLDGTLIDSHSGIECSIRHAIAEVLPGRSVGDVPRFIGPPIKDIMARILGPTEADTLDRLERAYRNSYDTDGWRRFRAYETVYATLRGLGARGDRCFLVTNKPLLPTRQILHELCLMDAFQEVVTRDSRTPPYASKTEALRWLVEVHGLNTATTIFVGDTSEDADCAASVGCWFAHATYGYGESVGCERGIALSRLADVLDWSP